MSDRTPQDLENLKRIQDEAAAAIEKGDPYRGAVELSDGSTYGEAIIVTSGCPHGPIKLEWAAAVADMNPDSENA
jgi:hypothetical protein